MYNEYEIRTVPISLNHCRRDVSEFLHSNGLRLDDVDYYACIYQLGDDTIVAGGGLKRNTIKCIAVDNHYRDQGFMARLVSHLISQANQQGYNSTRVFTKPENRQVFESMGFTLIAQAPEAILLENPHELRTYCQYLSRQRRMGKSGIIVMNANPFTKGHRYLIEKAASMVEWLHVIIVYDHADKHIFTYEERKDMVEEGTKDLSNVFVIEGSEYQVSQTTFPTYFLKETSSATDTQITLDLDIFTHFIAPHLGATTRFVGTETNDNVTSRYNHLMKQFLDKRGYEVVEIPRLTTTADNHQEQPISASTVRSFIKEKKLNKAFRLAHKVSWKYIMAALASKALKEELNTSPKPGLVDILDNGAHQDMDYQLMSHSIDTLRPFFARLCIEGEPQIEEIIDIGKQAEAAMMKVTNGVNTHRGAFFSLGITTVAAYNILATNTPLTTNNLSNKISQLARKIPPATNTHGATVRKTFNIKGAHQNATDGYDTLFNEWLPFYRTLNDDTYRNHKTLLKIMSTLDDSNIYHRKGAHEAAMVRHEAQTLLDNFSTEGMDRLNQQYIVRNISPGGSADMLALTIFIDSLCE